MDQNRQLSIKGFEYAELMTMALEREQKFEYAFASLIFATLGLSIQFMGGIGINAPWLAISGWILLLISGTSAGWRLMHHPPLLKMNAEINRKKALQASSEVVAGMKIVFDKKAGKFHIHWKIQVYCFFAALILLTAFSVLNFMVKAKILNENVMAHIMCILHLC